MRGLKIIFWSSESILMSVRLLIAAFMKKLELTFTEGNMIERRVFSERMGVFSHHQSARSSSEWNKTKALSKECSVGNFKLPNEILMETIEHVVTKKSDCEFWHQRQNTFYQPLEFLEHREFDSRLKMKKSSDESFLWSGSCSMQTISEEIKPASA